MAGNRGHSCNQPNPPIDIPGRHRGDQTTHIGRQVDHLYPARGMAGIQLCQPHKSDHKKGPGTRSIITVIGADNQCRKPDNERLFLKGHRRRLIRPVPPFQGNESHHRKHRQQHVLKDRIRSVMLKPGPSCRPKQRKGNGRSKQFPLHKPVFYKSGGGKERPHATGQLIGPKGIIKRQAMKGHEIGGQ